LQQNEKKKKQHKQQRTMLARQQTLRNGSQLWRALSTNATPPLAATVPGPVKGTGGTTQPEVAFTKVKPLVDIVHDQNLNCYSL
jgi:hypothetical protein